jgi:hypothetical protein
MRQGFLSGAPHRADPAHVLSQNVAERALMRPFHNADRAQRRF